MKRPCARVGAMIASATMVLALATACRSLPSADEPTAPRPTPTSEAAPGGFAIPVSMLDAWNAVGQIVVRLDGVTYQGRSQMLGLYDVRYRGEHFLIVTRARVMQAPTDGMLTEVAALQPDGKPNNSAAAIELLGLLQQRMPGELARIAAGER